MGNHRAQRRSKQRPAAGHTPVQGRLKATKRGRTRRLLWLPGRHPAVPTLVGVAVLVVAGTAAVAVPSTPVAPKRLQLSSEGPSLAGPELAGTDLAGTDLSGTDAVGFVSDPRERALSRDSERQALQEAADTDLKQAATQQAAERNAELKSLSRAAEARAGEIAENQWQLPTTAYHLTARFGMSGGMWSSNHTGLDFAAPTGTPIVAVANGVITETGSAGAYGNQTIETLEDGTEIWYCHQTSIGVQTGQVVTGGQQIGTVGSTGNTTGPHLHLEVRPGGGDPVDPDQALVFHGVTP